MNTQPADSDEKVDGSDYREKSPGYAAQNMLYRLAKRCVLTSSRRRSETGRTRPPTD